jgi:hypothetical protein
LFWKLEGRAEIPLIRNAYPTRVKAARSLCGPLNASFSGGISQFNSVVLTNRATIVSDSLGGVVIGDLAHKLLHFRCSRRNDAASLNS